MTHPYFPVTAHLPGFVAQDVHFTVILGLVGGVAVGVFALVWLISGERGRAFPCALRADTRATAVALLRVYAAVRHGAKLA